MTSDLRFTMRGDGPLDLQLRVTRNGDTCVENRGAQAPVLNVADQFGEAAYELRAAQHVLFEHGSLKEAVDSESSSCGCPPEQTMSVADALLHAAGSGNGTPGDAATAAWAMPITARIVEDCGMSAAGALIAMSAQRSGACVRRSHSGFVQVLFSASSARRSTGMSAGCG